MGGFGFGVEGGVGGATIGGRVVGSGRGGTSRGSSVGSGSGSGSGSVTLGSVGSGVGGAGPKLEIWKFYFLRKDLLNFIKKPKVVGSGVGG